MNLTPAQDVLDVLREDDTAALARLHSRLEGAAEREGLLDVAYRTLDTPLGSLLLAGTPVGLVRVAYASEGHDGVLDALAERVSPRILRAPARLDGAAREVDEYFAGTRTHFDLPLDLRLAEGFRREVIEHLRESGTDAARATRRLPQPSGIPARFARWAPPVPAIRSRWSFRVIGWSARTARSVSTSAAPKPSRPC